MRAGANIASSNPESERLPHQAEGLVGWKQIPAAMTSEKTVMVKAPECGKGQSGDGSLH